MLIGFIRKHHRKAIPFKISLLTSSDRRVATARSTASSRGLRNADSRVYGYCELDSHADTIVAGSNCVVLQYTGQECDVSPFSDDFKPVKGVPIAHVATAWQSPVSGQTYILVFNEALWMGTTMDHTLLNPNQLRHYGTIVQDNPTLPLPLSIIAEDRSFCMELFMQGTTVRVQTYSPTQTELETCPHVVLSSPSPWDPNNISFPKSRMSIEEMMNDMRHVSSTTSSQIEDVAGSVFDLSTIVRRISSMRTTPTKLASPDERLIGRGDVPPINTFQSLSRHSDVTPQSLSERWCISIPTATLTLKKTTQRFLRSAILLLGRRY